MQAIAAIHKLSRRLRLRGWPFGARLLEGLIRIAFGASLPARADIGKDVFFHHSGLGVVINGDSVIENGCEIGVHVVLGGRAPLPGAPYLEKNVIVHAGAKIIGPVRVGAGSIVAANAVVLSDMPANCLIAGVPAVVKRAGIDNSRYRRGVALKSIIVP